MKIRTRDYGEVEVDAASIINFDDGIIGFEECHDYILLDGGDDMSPFKCLQSIDDCDLAFMLLDPFVVRPDYEAEIGDDAAARLSIDSDEDIAVFVIVVVPDDVKQMSFNLKAPIIINARAKKGAQYIVDNGDYSVRHYLADEIERLKRQAPDKGRAAV